MTVPGAGQALIVSADSLFWIEGNSIMKAPATGGTPAPVATGQASPHALAVDDQYVYWTNYLGASVMRAPKDASSPASLVASAAEPDLIAVDSSAVYWTNIADQTIRSSPKTSNAPQLVTSVGEGVSSIAIDATYVYLGLRSPGRIMSVLKTGGTLSGVFACPYTGGGGSADSLATDVDNLYFTCSVSLSTITGILAHAFSLSKAGGCAVDFGEASHLVVGGQWVYFFDFTNVGRWFRVAAVGGKLSQIVLAGTQPQAAAADSTYLYLLTNSGIIRL
jgi:hypothetical protein